MNLRAGGDRAALQNFVDLLTRRYFPVLSLTYVSSVIGMAGQRGDFLDALFHDRMPYVKGLLVAAWVSIPAVLWIIVKGLHAFEHRADDCYKIGAGLMIVTLAMSYLLFPEANVWGLRTYFAATIPMFLVMYAFFVKGGLPGIAAHPLTVLGLTFLIYGAAIRFLY